MTLTLERLGGVMKPPVKLYANKLINSQAVKDKRKILRLKATKYEKILWKHLKNKQIKDYKFRRQQSIGRYIVDFYCPEAKLVIEVDGGNHFFDKVSSEYDSYRQKFIESKGIKIIRIGNHDIALNIDGVLQAIFQNLP